MRESYEEFRRQEYFASGGRSRRRGTGAGAGGWAPGSGADRDTLGWEALESARDGCVSALVQGRAHAQS